MVPLPRAFLCRRVMELGAVSSGTRRTNRVCRRRHVEAIYEFVELILPPQGALVPPLGALVPPGSSVPPGPMSDVSWTNRTNC